MLACPFIELTGAHAGHTSWTFAAFVFLSLYLYYFIRPGGAADSVDLLMVMLPTMVAGWVGMTRVIDNRHNPSDVLAGAPRGSALQSRRVCSV